MADYTELDARLADDLTAALGELATAARRRWRWDLAFWATVLALSVWGMLGYATVLGALDDTLRVLLCVLLLVSSLRRPALEAQVARAHERAETARDALVDAWAARTDAERSARSSWTAAGGDA